MRIILFIIFYSAILSSSTKAQSGLQLLYDDIVINGMIDYPLLLENRSKLDSAKLKLISNHARFVPASQVWTANAINLYNVLVLDQILDHYPVESVEQIRSFFTRNISSHKDQFSLDELEQSILYHSKDQRIHFVLNCGARGCPEFPAVVLNAESLDQQLNDYKENALSNKNVIDINHNSMTIHLNQIFKWYYKDFEKPTVIEYISGELNQPELVSYNIKYQTYDWSLNSYQTIRYNATRLYEKGEFEIHLFNNYYTQKESGALSENNFGRYNFLNHFFQGTLGLNRKINIGIGFKFRSVSQNIKSLSGTLDALKYRNNGFIYNQDAELEGYTRAGLTAIYPSIKYAPFRSNKNISVFHALYIPIGYALEGNEDYGFLDWNGFSLQNNLSFNYDLAPDRSIYLDAALLIENIDGHLFGQGTGYSQIGLSFTYIYNIYPNRTFNYYGLINLAPRLAISVYDESTFEFIPYAQLGTGFKYYITNKLESELLYTFFFDGTANRTAHTFNVGLRYYGI